MVPLRSQGNCGGGRGLSGLHWVWCIGRGPHFQLRQEPQSTSDQTPIAGSLQTGDRRVRPRLGLRHGTPPASRDVPGERGRLSSCLWKLGFFSERCTEKLPLRVDLIHRVEFGEVSGHRVLIKRGPGNRGPTECGTTDRKSTRLNSSHQLISYAVFCLKKKKKTSLLDHKPPPRPLTPRRGSHLKLT